MRANASTASCCLTIEQQEQKTRSREGRAQPIEEGRRGRMHRRRNNSKTMLQTTGVAETSPCRT